MNLQDLKVMLTYNYWSRDRLFKAVERLSAEQYTKDLGSSFPSIRDTLVHTYSAEWIWYSRWQGASPAAMLRPEAFPDLTALRNAWDEHKLKMRSFLDGLGEEGIRQVIDYRYLTGQAGRQAFWQMLQHVVNHGSYHRGQITTMLRQLSVAPPESTDLIMFYREPGGGQQ